MRFNFKIYDIIMASMFLLAIVLIAFNFLLPALNFVAMGLLIAGTLMLMIKLIKNYSTFKREITQEHEEFLMELCSTSEGASYVLNNQKLQSKQAKEIKRACFDKMMVIVACGIIICGLAFLLIRMLFNF